MLIPALLNGEQLRADGDDAPHMIRTIRASRHPSKRGVIYLVGIGYIFIINSHTIKTTKADVISDDDLPWADQLPMGLTCRNSQFFIIFCVNNQFHL